MINLNTAQITALTSLIYNELKEEQKNKKNQYIQDILNNPEFINSFNKYLKDIKAAEKMYKDASKLELAAYREFNKKYPVGQIVNMDTLEKAANYYVSSIYNDVTPIKKTKIKEDIALCSIDSETIEDIKNKILSLYK